MNKKFLLFTVMLLQQSITFCMEPSKKLGSKPMGHQTMTYQLHNGSVIIVNPGAVALCQQLNVPQETFNFLFPGRKSQEIPFALDLSDDETIAFFNILNTIPQKATKTLTGGYVSPHVYNIVKNTLRNFSNESLTNILSATDFLMCPIVLNALIAIIIEKPGIIETIGNLYSQQPDLTYAIITALHNNGFETIHEGLMPLLLKHVKRVNLANQAGSYIQEYSLLDHVALKGIKKSAMLLHDFSGKGYNFKRARLTSLDGLQNLQEHFGDIQIIDFSHNFLELAELTPENSFKYFPNIQSIDLSHNYLTQCHPQLFSYVENLYALDLSDNNLIFLDPSIFHPLKGLDYLYLSNNQLSNLDPNLFSTLSALEELTLDHNKLTILNPKLFSNLTNLNLLTLDNNMLTVLPHGIFENAQYLTTLDLSDNQFKYINPNLFELMEDLSDLKIENNPLDENNTNELQKFISN